MCCRLTGWLVLCLMQGTLSGVRNCHDCSVIQVPPSVARRKVDQYQEASSTARESWLNTLSDFHCTCSSGGGCGTDIITSVTAAGGTVQTERGQPALAVCSNKASLLNFPLVRQAVFTERGNFIAFCRERNGTLGEAFIA